MIAFEVKDSVTEHLNETRAALHLAQVEAERAHAELDRLGVPRRDAYGHTYSLAERCVMLRFEMEWRTLLQMELEHLNRALTLGYEASERRRRVLEAANTANRWAQRGVRVFSTVARYAGIFAGAKPCATTKRSKAELK